MLRRHRKSLVLVTLFVVATLVGAAAVEAAVAKGKIVLTRGTKPVADAGLPELFGASSPNSRDYCEGWCNANYCECTGTLDCCIAGCNLCWDIFFPM